MQIKGLLYGLVAAALVSLAMPAVAERTMPYHLLSEQERQEVRERWDRMSPEERAGVRRKADEHWAGLSDEERAAKREELRQYHARGGRSRAHDKWAGMTPEERRAHREELRERWEAMTPEERQAHRAMMRSPHTGKDKSGDAQGKAREGSEDRKERYRKD